MAKKNLIGSFPAGEYYVGDLCYVISNDEWDEKLMNLMYPDDDVNASSHDGEHPWKNGKLWLHSTAYGDGCFPDNHGREYAVDAGLIGVLPVEFITKRESNGTDINDLGHIITFTEAFECVYEDGTFLIGDDISIYTEDY